jgi:molecular chaperone HtpG
MTKQQAEKKTVKFETEVSKLLDIVANSLYTEKEIFLRELISNASDACEKLRYVSQTDTNVKKTDKFEIRIHVNEKNKTITIQDNGIGMDENDMQANLGTIAKSGTEDFIKKLGDKKGDINQIGKFGVGFYSSFMVSDQVVVRSKKLTPLLATCGHLMERVLFLLNQQNLICLVQKSHYLSKKMRMSF